MFLFLFVLLCLFCYCVAPAPCEATSLSKCHTGFCNMGNCPTPRSCMAGRGAQCLERKRGEPSIEPLPTVFRKFMADEDRKRAWVFFFFFFYKVRFSDTFSVKKNYIIANIYGINVNYKVLNVVFVLAGLFFFLKKENHSIQHFFLWFVPFQNLFKCVQ